ncbi:MAG TPA: class I SAM-dependent methyltransferase [Xanthobacteraceae bacterium]|nr:class I SAM-dependent methyltransferase [Xanthobacteraceae bacterium]
MKVTYNPAVFNANDISHAMAIILTPEDSTTEERWQTETPYVCDLIAKSLKITPSSFVLDYGCGIGRIAKELIVRHGCRVIGVDISPNMRALSVMYVQSDRFAVCTPEMLTAMTERGFRFDVAISIWVLQHCLSPADDVARLRSALDPAGSLFVLNDKLRCVPTVEVGWVDDSIDVRAVLMQNFDLRQEGRLDPGRTTEDVTESSYWGAFSVPHADEA